MGYICTVCNQPEESCECQRYCMLCQSEDGVRLCDDGCYYCDACRDACDFKAET